MTQKVAWLKGASRVIGVDIQPYRLETARRTANSETLDAAEKKENRDRAGDPRRDRWARRGHLR
jgi:threonine dehydrogenase-like Zn-dependent dehydrogenase